MRNRPTRSFVALLLISAALLFHVAWPFRTPLAQPSSAPEIKAA